MAYTNQTVNYGIPLPLGTDKFNPLDWNDSSEKIDAAVHDAQSVAQTAAQDIVTLQADVTGLKNEDIAIKQAATELTGRVTTLEQSDAKVTDDIQDCLDMITAREVIVAQSPIEIAVGKWFRYNGILYVCTVEIGIGDTIVPNVNCRATNIESEMGQGGGSVTAAAVSFNDTIDLGASNVQEGLVKTNAKITPINTTLTDILARIESLEKGGGMQLDYEQAVTIKTTQNYMAPSAGIFYLMADSIVSDFTGRVHIGDKLICSLSYSASGGVGGYNLTPHFPVTANTQMNITLAKATFIFIPYVQ